MKSAIILLAALAGLLTIASGAPIVNNQLELPEVKAERDWYEPVDPSPEQDSGLDERDPPRWQPVGIETMPFGKPQSGMTWGPGQ